MANPDHSAKLIEGVESWNAWRDQNPDIVPDLSGIYLVKTNLNQANFYKTNLQDANLSEAHLRDTIFKESNLSGADLSDTNLSDADLSCADMRKTNLSGASLFRVNLRQSNLSEAKLDKASIVEAHLEQIDLSYAEVNEVDFFAIELSEANLLACNFSGSTFFVTNLSRSNLSMTKLWGVELFESNLTDADLSNSDLWLSHFNRCNLTNAKLDNAIVKDIRISELKGEPQKPSQLRMDQEGKEILIGKKAQEFFQTYSIVEIYMNHSLGYLEMICIHLFLTHLHANHIGIGVRLFFQQQEVPNTLLRFQAATYREIYQIAPSLLLLFPSSKQIDWERSIASIPNQEVIEKFKGLLQTMEEPQEQIHAFALALRKLFPVFQTINISSIKHIGSNSQTQIRILKKEHEIEEEELRSKSISEPLLITAIDSKMGIFLSPLHSPKPT